MLVIKYDHFKTQSNSNGGNRKCHHWSININYDLLLLKRLFLQNELKKSLGNSICKKAIIVKGFILDEKLDVFTIGLQKSFDTNERSLFLYKVFLCHYNLIIIINVNFSSPFGTGQSC